MTVLKGEGKVPILYGTTALPIGQNLPAYLARPDLAGVYPTVLIAHGAWGLTPHVRDLCRRIARHGYAVTCPDLYRGRLGGRPGDLDEATQRFGELAAPGAVAALRRAHEAADAAGSPWASVSKLAIVGLGAAGSTAAAAAAALPDTDALVLVCAPVVPGQLPDLPVLGIFGADDEVVPADTARRLGERPGVRVAVYGGVGHDFLDDGRDGYDRTSAEDALERIVGFLDARLGSTTG